MELTELTLDFFRQVGFSCMGSMEYKRDIRDGRFYMVEPTVGRTDFQEEVATVNGVNLPFFAYCHEMSLPPTHVQPVNPKRIWREDQIDKWSKQQSSDRDDRPNKGYKLVDSYLRWGDPLPWLDHVFARIKTAFERR